MYVLPSENFYLEECEPTTCSQRRNQPVRIFPNTRKGKFLLTLCSDTWYRWYRVQIKLFYHIPDICHFFSTYVIFGSIFLHTKVRKSRQKRFCDKTAYITTKPIFKQNSVTCTYVKTFSTSYTCQMWRNFKFLHICHVEKFEITQHGEKFQISPHLSCIQIWNFSTWQIFLHISNLWYLWQISGMAKYHTWYFLRSRCYLPDTCTGWEDPYIVASSSCSFQPGMERWKGEAGLMSWTCSSRVFMRAGRRPWMPRVCLSSRVKAIPLNLFGSLVSVYS